MEASKVTMLLTERPQSGKEKEEKSTRLHQASQSLKTRRRKQSKTGGGCSLAKTKSKSANRGGACEARTAVVARSGTPGEDLVVEVEGKVRRYAVLKVRPQLAVVAIHVMRNDGSEQPKIATGHALQALQAPTGQLGKDWTVFAAGDWNFSRQLLQPERLGLATSGASYQVLSALPGVPTTLADQLKWVDGDRSTWSDGIDGALVLAPPGDATLAVKVV